MGLFDDIYYGKTLPDVIPNNIQTNISITHHSSTPFFCNFDSTDASAYAFKRSYAAMWNFDVLRPLYNGFDDYLYEIRRLCFHPLVILPRFFRAMGNKLSNDIKEKSSSNFLMHILSTIIGAVFFIALAIYSMLTGLLGLFTRPLITKAIESYENICR